MSPTTQRAVDLLVEAGEKLSEASRLLRSSRHYDLVNAGYELTRGALTITTAMESQLMTGAPRTTHPGAA